MRATANGFERALWLVRGEIAVLRFEPQPIGNLFAAGHRIRIDVQSSSFPHFEVNDRPAEITLFHDAARPSHVVLSVVPPFGDA